MRTNHSIGRSDGAVASRRAQLDRLTRSTKVARSGDTIGEGARHDVRDCIGWAGHRFLRACLAVGVGGAGDGCLSSRPVEAGDGLPAPPQKPRALNMEDACLAVVAGEVLLVLGYGLRQSV